MGTITYSAVSEKIVGTNNGFKPILTISSTDASDRIVYRWTGEVLTSTNTNWIVAPKNVVLTAANTSLTDVAVFAVNDISLYTDLSSITNSTVYYLDKDKKKGSCNSFTDLPSEFETIYRWQPPASTILNELPKVKFQYAVWIAAEIPVIPAYEDLVWIDAEVSITEIFEVSLNDMTNTFLHYLHLGTAVTSAFSINPYEVLPGAVDGAVFVDPLTSSPAGTGPYIISCPTLPSGWQIRDYPFSGTAETLITGKNYDALPANGGFAFRITPTLLKELTLSYGILIGSEGTGARYYISRCPGNFECKYDGFIKQPRYYMFTKNGVRQYGPTYTSTVITGVNMEAALASFGWIEQEKYTYYLNVGNTFNEPRIGCQMKFIHA